MSKTDCDSDSDNDGDDDNNKTSLRTMESARNVRCGRNGRREDLGDRNRT